MRATVGPWILAVGMIALVGACGGGGGGTPPAANAGTDQTAPEDTLVSLSGTATAGSNPVALVAWTQTGGPAVTLSGADTDSPSFTAPAAPIRGTVTVELLFTVTDTRGQSDSDSVVVTVTSTDFALFLATKDLVTQQELYKSDVETGAVTKLSGPLVVGGIVNTFQISPDGRYVAYTAIQDTAGVLEVYVARTDGSGFVKASGTMVAGGGAAGLVSWAPDSSRVAYWARQDDATVTELYTSRPDGTGNARINGTLAPGGNVFIPPSLASLWAPDSSRLAYVADQDTLAIPEAYTSLPDGTDNAKVSGTLVAGGAVQPNPGLFWAPDSSRIAYLANQDDPAAVEFYATLPTGPAAQKLNGPLVPGGNVTTGFGPRSEVWVPDSSRVVYLADQDTDDVQELYSSRFDGSDNTRLNPPLTAPGFVSSFEISPDGSQVAYTADAGGGGTVDIFACLIGGGGTVMLNEPLVAGGNVGAFRWAPDASRVAYVADQDTDDVFELYTSLPDGTGNAKLNGPLPATGSAAINVDPATPGDWAPDASLLSYVVFAAPMAPALHQIPGFAALPDGAGSVEYTGVMDPAGTGLKNWPRWSPDSSALLYVAAQDSATVTELYLSSPEGLLNEKVSGPLVAGGNVSSQAFAWAP